MKFILSLSVLVSFVTPSFSAWATLTMDSLLEMPQDFIPQNLPVPGHMYAVQFVPKEKLADVPLTISHGLGFGAVVTSDWNHAVSLSRRSDGNVYPILLVDFSSVENPRFLKYKKSNHQVKDLDRLFKDDGVRYMDRDRAYQLLASKYEIDAIENNDGEFFILRPQRFRIRSLKETVDLHRAEALGTPKAREEQIKVFKDIACHLALEL